MDESERKRLRLRFKEMCSASGYPDNERPRPWDIDTKKAEREAKIQHAADNREELDEDPS